MTVNHPSEYKTYHNNLSSILINLQYIEEMIRMNMSSCYEIIIKNLNGTIPFKFRYKDLEKDPLGKLIYKYEKFCDDCDFIKELKDLIQHRNGVAHKGWLLTVAQQQDVEYLKQLNSDLEKIKHEQRRILKKW